MVGLLLHIAPYREPLSLLVVVRLFMALQFPHDVHELARTDGSHDVPPPMKLQQPGPRQSNPFPKVSQLCAILKVNVPETVGNQEHQERFPSPCSPREALGFRELGLEPMEKMMTPQYYAKDHGGECCRVVDDLSSPDIKSREERKDNGKGDRDVSSSDRRLPNHQSALEKRPSKPEHGKLISELESVAEGCMEEERRDAKDQDGDGHEVRCWRQKTLTAGPIHMPKGEVDWPILVSRPTNIEYKICIDPRKERFCRGDVYVP